MLVTDGYKTKFVVVAICVFIIVSELYLVSGKECNGELPVLRFCTDGKVNRTSTVLLDGTYANTLNGVQNCTCTARTHINRTTKLIFEDIPYLSSFNKNNSCGSKVVFTQQNYAERSKICGGDGALPISDTINDITITITLVKVAYPKDTNYNFCMLFAPGNLMDITCEGAAEGVITTQSHDRHETDHTTVMYPEVTTTHLVGTELATSEGITEISTTTQHKSTDTDNLEALNTAKIQIDESDNSKTTYIAIGCGTCGLLIAVLVGILFLRKLRQNKEQLGDENDICGDSEDYGVQYNTLYISAEGEAIPQFDVESSSVIDVLAPGDGGCEYAIVEKESADSIQNDVYAVVDRNRKRNS